MKTKAYFRLLVGAYCLLLLACAVEDASVPIKDDYGHVHYTPHHLTDKTGQRHFPLKISPRAQNVFMFDPKVSAWAAYNKAGERVMTGRASGGSDYCEDIDAPCRTAVGSFTVYKKGTAKCISGEFPIETDGGTKMPYCIYFHQGFTIHAGYDFSEGNTSHGCIRVLPSAAKWLNESFLDIGSRVIVLPY